MTFTFVYDCSAMNLTSLLLNQHFKFNVSVILYLIQVLYIYLKVFLKLAYERIFITKITVKSLVTVVNFFQVRLTRVL